MLGQETVAWDLGSEPAQSLGPGGMQGAEPLWAITGAGGVWGGARGCKGATDPGVAGPTTKILSGTQLVPGVILSVSYKEWNTVEAA